MEKKYLPLLFVFVLTLNNVYSINIKQLVNTEEKNVSSSNLSKKSTKPPKAMTRKEKKNSAKKTFLFDAVNEPLVNIINKIAAQKDLNIIFPQGALAITANVNYRLKEKLTIDEAWIRILDILSLLNYTIRNDVDGLITIVKNDTQNIAREPFTIYVDQPLSALPETPEVIKAIFYLRNLSLKVSGSDIVALLKDMLSPNADVKIDPKTNAIILTDKSTNIINVMKIIQEIDKTGIRESIEVLPIYYTSAQLIDDLFNKQLLGSNQQSPTGTPSGQPSFFPKNTKILALERTNSLVIMGTQHGIDTAKDFIIKYIDRPLESGESILHVYELQYLNATQFAPILQQLVTPAQRDQATGKATGPQQYFKDVIIQAEIVRKTELIQPTQPGGTPTGGAQTISEGAQLGGNRLIIAARKKDWLRIKPLITELDKPQPQVAMEVLIVDLTISEDKLAAAQIRNKSGLKESLSKNVDFQVANIGSPIVNQNITTNLLGDTTVNVPTTGGLLANLLQFFPDNPGVNLANNATPGSLIISLNDSVNGAWGLLQVLNQFTNTTILAQPFLVTTNHQQATATLQEERLLPGDADTSNNAVAVKFESVVAGITVDILPHITLKEKGQGTKKEGNINMQVSINYNQFEGNNSNNRNTRVVQTCANVGNGQVLALGGLIKENDNISTTQLSPLSKIPIFGWLFKGQEQIKTKNMLLVLICPTIIEPRLKGGTDSYTEKKLALAQDDIDEHLAFENLRDPITRWFFNPDPTYGRRVIEDYVHAASHQEGEKDDFYFNAIRPNIRKALAQNETSNDSAINLTHENNLNQNISNQDNLNKAEMLKTLVMNEPNPLSQEPVNKESVK